MGRRSSSGRDKLPTVLNEEEQEKLLGAPNKDAPTGFRNYVMMELMLNCGLRISEVTLNIEDDGEDLNSLRLNHIDKLRSKIEIKDAKGSKDRNVWVNEGTLNDLEKWINWRADLIEEDKIPRPSSVNEKYEGLVFITFNGTPVKHSYMRRRVKEYAKESGISKWKDVSPHTLRHSFATDLYRETNNLRKVQKSLGHSDTTATEIYTHIADEELKEAMIGLRE